MSQCRLIDQIGPVDVPNNRLIQLVSITQRTAKRAKPAAKRRHHLSHILADDDIANPRFAELAVHVVDEHLGQQDHILRVRRRGLKPEQNQRQHRRHHVEPTIEAVRYLPLFVPVRLARPGDDLLVQWQKPVSGVGPGLPEQTFQKRHSHYSSAVHADLHIDLGRQGCNGEAFEVSQKPENGMRKSQIISLTALVTAMVITSGCTRLRAHQGYIGDATLLASVQPGVDNKESVQASLGRPTFVGQFDQNDWYYYARDTQQLAFAQPKAKSQYVLKVRFDPAGNVLSSTQTGVETIANISPNGDKTPTLGRNASFFEEIFGNIGSVGAGSGQGSTPNSPN